jgi:hypothetical protein
LDVISGPNVIVRRILFPVWGSVSVSRYTPTHFPARKIGWLRGDTISGGQRFLPAYPTTRPSVERRRELWWVDDRGPYLQQRN